MLILQSGEFNPLSFFPLMYVNTPDSYYCTISGKWFTFCNKHLYFSESLQISLPENTKINRTAQNIIFFMNVQILVMREKHQQHRL